MRRLPTGLGILALTGSLLVGCGGGDDDAADALRDGEDPQGEADGGNALEGGDGDGGDGGDGGGNDDDRFCAEAADLEERLGSLELGGEALPSSEQFAQVSTGFEDLAEDAPDEVAGDMRRIADALTALGEVFERIDIQDPESLEVLEEESARLEEEFGDLEAAGENVETYLKEECGIDLGGDANAEPDGTGDGTGDGGQDDGGTGDNGTGNDGTGDGGQG